MAIAIVAGTTKTSTIGAAVITRGQSPTGNVTVGNKLIVAVHLLSSGVSALSVADNSSQAGTANTYTQIGSGVQNGSPGVFVFYCDVTRAILSTDSITASWTGSSINAIGISEWSGVTSGTAAASKTTSATTANPTTGALTTPSENGDLVIGFFSQGAANAYTVGTDGQGNTMTSLHAPATAQSRSIGDQYLIESTSLAYNPGCSFGASTACASMGVRFAPIPAPANTVAPAVTGNLSVGQTLSTTTGTWTGDISSGATYAWQRDVAGNAVYSNIGSATASTYGLVDADDGCHVRCVVTETGTGGATSANSNAVGLITEPAPANSVAPAVTGNISVGQTLTTTNGTWTGMGGSNPTYTYAWQRDVAGNSSYSDIGSATASTYVLVTADDTCHVRCNVTAHNTNTATTTQASNVIGPAVLAIPTNSVAPVASGTAQVGQVVSSTTGTWTSTPSSYGYQWQDSADGSSGWANIASATSATYTIAAGEVTKYLRCNVRATNDGGTSAATASNTLGPDIAAAPTGSARVPAPVFFHLLELGG